MWDADYATRWHFTHTQTLAHKTINLLCPRPMSMLRRLRIHFHFHFSRKCIREIKNNVIAVLACAVPFMDIISLTFVNIFVYLHASCLFIHQTKRINIRKPAVLSQCECTHIWREKNSCLHERLELIKIFVSDLHWCWLELSLLSHRDHLFHLVID